MKYLHLVWKNVFRKRTRMFLTTGSIVLVLVLIVVLTCLLQAMEQDPSGGKGSNRLVVQHATGLANFLPLSQRQRIEQIGFVRVLAYVSAADRHGDDLCTARFDCSPRFGEILVFTRADQQARGVGLTRNQ